MKCSPRFKLFLKFFKKNKLLILLGCILIIIFILYATTFNVVENFKNCRALNDQNKIYSYSPINSVRKADDRCVESCNTTDKKYALGDKCVITCDTKLFITDQKKNNICVSTCPENKFSIRGPFAGQAVLECKDIDRLNLREIRNLTQVQINSINSANITNIINFLNNLLPTQIKNLNKNILNFLTEEQMTNLGPNFFNNLLPTQIPYLNKGAFNAMKAKEAEAAAAASARLAEASAVSAELSAISVRPSEPTKTDINRNKAPSN
jgi:hypothetical protein